MAKEIKKKEHIPRPKEDVKIDESEPKFNSALSSFVKNHTTKPEQNDNSGNK